MSANASPCHQGENEELSEHFRRRSEGSEPTSTSFNNLGVSFNNSSPILRCRYSRCGRTTLATTDEAKLYKNCHNCSYIYCSRGCRRAHWEKHRKTCLFSRIGTLCRQIIAAAKEQRDTLIHLSKEARRGYVSHGLGAVKCFFPNPEAAETFLLKGLRSLGELTYVRWQDLLPSEMGPQLYAELVKMCKNYNPDSKLVLYVSVCVISETPAAGAVKWERQLVSRCAKMRLSKEVQIPERELMENPETLIFISPIFHGDKFIIKSMREKMFENLQAHLRCRGVSLKRQHPDIFAQMKQYCEDTNIAFTPATVYPRDSETGKSFMCIIMLEVTKENLVKLENAGVKVRTVDLMKELLIE